VSEWESVEGKTDLDMVYAAAERRQVFLRDGRVGRLAFWSIPPSAGGKGKRRYRGRQAQVLRDGIVVYVHQREIVGIEYDPKDNGGSNVT